MKEHWPAERWNAIRIRSKATQWTDFIYGKTVEENALLDARMEDFRRNPDAGILLEELRTHVTQRLPLQ